MTLAHIVDHLDVFLIGAAAMFVFGALVMLVGWWLAGPDPDADTPGTDHWELRG